MHVLFNVLNNMLLKKYVPLGANKYDLLLLFTIYFRAISQIS